MDIQAQAMSRAVKESLHSPLDPSRRKAPGLEQIQNLLVNISAIDAIANHIEADLLTGLDRGVNRFELVGGAPAHHRPAQVAEVAVLLRTGKDVEDNRCVGFDGTRSFVMRIHALVARRNNSVTRQPTLRHNRRIDGGLEGFRSQARTIEIKVTIAADLWFA